MPADLQLPCALDAYVASCASCPTASTGISSWCAPRVLLLRLATGSLIHKREVRWDVGVARWQSELLPGILAGAAGADSALPFTQALGGDGQVQVGHVEPGLSVLRRTVLRDKLLEGAGLQVQAQVVWAQEVQH